MSFSHSRPSSWRSWEQELVGCALHYINTRTSETPRLLLTNFSWEDFDDFKDGLNNPYKISAKDADTLRFDYNPETLTLRISSVPEAAHTELEDFLTTTLMDLRHANIITKAEQEQLHIGFSREFSLPYRETTRKAPAFAKQPDAFIGLKDRSKCFFPRVIFEVDFSQSYEEVLDDTRQWLVRSAGGVRLVVLIYIEEHPIPALRDDDDDDQHSDDSTDSDVAMYQRFYNSCNVDNHVGPLSAFAELYRLGGAGIYRVGARINIISPPSVSPPAPAGQIQLSITDLLPDVVDNRVIDFDLAVFARGLQHSRRDMALSRILRRRRARRRAAASNKAVDADYQP
ncbi:hypothetical protein Q9L58_002975 [Maublancomyces gigas]|uniref:Uncharacterized protein n=1 Tax=Discina gigas TaxID=1032678 RepID=A0ABR3GQ52_9PEZI